ncbi:MAG: DUF2089 domain-containing protein [Armatimonadetes bacterium]|jgi:hypothetical protein|nr:DUF2089 domain-containing protein [Armatimonadota bacterium]
MNRSPQQCPVCDEALRVSELSCTACRTRLCGDFPPPPLARLSAEHQSFIETFVRCRGVIRDMERMLGISYPTVRAKLDSAVNALEATLADTAAPENPRRRTILRQVEEGSLTASEAAHLLAEL